MWKARGRKEGLAQREEYPTLARRGSGKGGVVVQEEENVDNDFIVCGFARFFSFYSTEPSESEPERLIFFFSYACRILNFSFFFFFFHSEKEENLVGGVCAQMSFLRKYATGGREST